METGGKKSPADEEAEAIAREDLQTCLEEGRQLAAGAANAAGVLPLVGRVASASEGSVSVSLEYASSTSVNQAWFFQTPYGAQFWQATAAYRQMRYVAPMPRNFNPWPPGGGWPGGWPGGGVIY